MLSVSETTAAMPSTSGAATSWPLSAAGHLDAHHPLAGLARGRCRELHGLTRSEKACGACWEHVIRTDAVFAAECDLPAQPPARDPLLVDEVAVERACAGESVRLTVAEVAEVARRVGSRGVPCGVLSRRVPAAARAGLLDPELAAALGLQAPAAAGSGRAA